MTGAALAGQEAAALVLSVVAVEGVRRLALRRSVLDIPNARSSHDRPVPRGGGLGLLLAAVAVWLLSGAALPWSGSTTVLVAAALVAGVSLVDDVRDASPIVRFGVQVAAAVVVVAATGGWETATVPGLDPVDLGPAGAVVAVVWLVGLANAFNFVDGIDALAGGQAVVAASALAVAAGVVGASDPQVLAVALAGASAGFLVHNRPPARIFLGDVGSVTLGFLLAALPLVLAEQADPPAAGRLALAAPALVWPVVFDAGATFVARLVRGEPVLQAHRRHLYQRLVVAGCGHGVVSVAYALLAAVTAVAACHWIDTGDGAPVLVALAATPVVLLTWVHRREGAAATSHG